MLIKNNLLKRLLTITSGLFAATALISCGDSDQSTAFSGPGGGIDGTGITAGSGNGSITGFGSVFFGDSRFATTNTTAITIDSITAGEADLKIGMVADYLIGEDATQGLTSGTAQGISVNSLIKGPVTSVNPLEVLGLPLLVTQQTQCEAIDCTTQPNLNLGDIVTVYGFQGTDNVVRSTRLERKSALAGNLPVNWKMAGRVNTIGSGLITIGNQVINTSGVTFTDCSGNASIGKYVTVTADPNSTAGFTTLNLVHFIRCGQSGIQLPSEAQQTVILGRAEGIVSGYTGLGDTQLLVGGQIVTLNPNSPSLHFENGTIEDLLTGAQVEITGAFNTNTQSLEAEKIKFATLRIEIVAPVNPATINLTTGSFDIMGITIKINLASSDEVGLLSGGLTSVRQLSIKAVKDGNDVIAEEIRDEGTPKFNEVHLQGPLDNPLPNTTFEILGIAINIDGATQITDSANQPLTGGVAEFFSVIAIGDRIEVQGSLSGGALPQITADSVELPFTL